MSINVTSPDPTGFDPDRLERLRQQMQADVDAARCDGVSILAGRAGNLVFSHSAGFARRDEGKAMLADSVCICFSSGKQFVNTLILSAVERGLLGFHQPVCEVLPEFANRGKEGITVAHLLTHTSGICTGLPPVAPEVMLSIEQLTAWAATSRPENAPGQRVCYSAIVGHAVLASLLLKVDGKGRNFATYLEEELFAPLGMNRTSLGVAERLRDEFNPLTTCYTRSGMFHEVEVQGVGAMTAVPGAEIPAGGYVTTAQDMYRFALMLSQGGEAGGTRILSPAMVEFAAENRTGDTPNDLLDYSLQMRRWSPWPGGIGLGFFVRVAGSITPGPLPNLGRPGTFGGWGSGTSCFWIDPSRELCFAMLTVGSMEDTEHIERTRRYSDALIASIVE